MSEFLALPLVVIALLAFAGGMRLVLAARRERALSRRRALQDFDVRERSADSGEPEHESRLVPRVAGFAVGLCVGALLAVPLETQFLGTLAVIALGCALGALAPDALTAVRRMRRREEIARRLPESIELLDVCVATGMGLDAAWSSVARQVRSVSEPVADEMEHTNLELELGVPRSVAVRHMAERTRAEDLSSLVALLIQSDRYGASIVEPLRTYARSVRERHSERAGQVAETLALRLMFPALFLVLPAVLIVTLGPVLLELSHILSNA